jgi:hypothetical protein
MYIFVVIFSWIFVRVKSYNNVWNFVSTMTIKDSVLLFHFSATTSHLSPYGNYKLILSQRNALTVLHNLFRPRSWIRLTLVKLLGCTWKVCTVAELGKCSLSDLNTLILHFRLTDPTLYPFNLILPAIHKHFCIKHRLQTTFIPLVLNTEVQGTGVVGEHLLVTSFQLLGSK